MTLTDFIKRATPASLYAPTATLGALKERNANPMFAAASTKEYGLDYYLRGALAGGICCGATHGAVTPVDVVKVRGGGNARARAPPYPRIFTRRRDAVNEGCGERVTDDECVSRAIFFTLDADENSVGSVQVRRHGVRLFQGYRLSLIHI